MNSKVKHTGLALALGLLPLQPGASDNDAQPSLEMLEYLAGWQKQNDEWLDPIEVMRMSQPPAPEKQTEEQADEK